MNNEYLRKISDQCRQYARKHYDPRRAERDDVTFEDVAQEMLKIAWQSYRNGNGTAKVIEEKKLIPIWQLRNFFLNTLRNFRIIIDEETEDMSCQQPPEIAKVVLDEDREIVDYYYPTTPDPLEEEEQNEKSILESMNDKEKEMWIKEIKKLKTLGYSDGEIIEMLTPMAQTKKERNKSNPIQQKLF